jgi:hypothetical protein
VHEVVHRTELVGLSERRVSHQDRGVETQAFRPGRKRRFTSSEMSVVVDSVFACPGTGCFPPPPRRR